MKITIEQLNAWKRSDRDNYLLDWFVENFPSGEADYQSVLDELANGGSILDYLAFDLIEKAGADMDVVLELESIECDSFFCAGTLVVKGDVRVKGHLRAGGPVTIGGDVSVGKVFSSGRMIEVGGNIASTNIVAEDSIRIGGNVNCHSCLVGGAIEVKGVILACGHVVSDAGGISAKRISARYDVCASGSDICVQEYLESGWNVLCDGSIVAGYFVRAGKGIQCKRAIKADWVSAGHEISTSEISIQKFVKAGKLIRIGEKIFRRGRYEKAEIDQI